MTPDTNVLVRVVVMDDPGQTASARAELAKAETVFLTLPALCEFCWVLRGRYRFKVDQVAEALRALIEAENALFDEAQVAAGLALLEQGGDFADAVIAEEGRRRGSRDFVSFDRAASRLLSAGGYSARRPA